MSISKDIIEELKKELDSKINQRETLLDQLQILDVLIDKYDTIIENIDREVLKLTKPLNDAANEVKAAYDARITSGCRSNLAWVETGRAKGFTLAGGTYKEVTLITYQVQENPATAAFKPYDGLKFYQKPSNRDYGSTLVAEFTGSVEEDSSVIAITVSDSELLNVVNTIEVGDTITDDLSSPKIFNLGNLPEVVGKGTTDAIGIVTTLVGGIFTSGTTFFHFGAGSLTDVEPGMLLIDTEETDPVLQENTTIVGFGTGDYPVEYYDEVGILTTSDVPCNIITIDKPAVRALEEGTFKVGIVSTFPALFISSTSNQTAVGASFIAIRTADRENIDKDFDPLSSPNAPLKIGAVDISNLGVGSSAYYDFSGSPSTVQSWNPSSERDELRGGKKNRDIFITEVKEPKVGAGQASYNIGTTQWPVRSIFGAGSSYAPLGTTIRTAFGSLSVATVSQPPGGIPPNCGDLDSNVSQAESKYTDTVSKNRTLAQKVATQSMSLRIERTRKEMNAYSLLQASSVLRQEIQRLQETLKELDGIDFRSYEKR